MTVGVLSTIRLSVLNPVFANHKRAWGQRHGPGQGRKRGKRYQIGEWGKATPFRSWRPFPFTRAEGAPLDCTVWITQYGLHRMDYTVRAGSLVLGQQQDFACGFQLANGGDDGAHRLFSILGFDVA